MKRLLIAAGLMLSTGPVWANDWCIYLRRAESVCWLEKTGNGITCAISHRASPVHLHPAECPDITAFLKSPTNPNGSASLTMMNADFVLGPHLSEWAQDVPQITENLTPMKTAQQVIAEMGDDAVRALVGSDHQASIVAGAVALHQAIASLHDAERLHLTDVQLMRAKLIAVANIAEALGHPIMIREMRPEDVPPDVAKQMGLPTKEEPK